MSREIDEIKDAAGDYRKWALEARKQYINLRLRQDPEIRALYIRSADRVARELRQLAVKTPSGRLRKRQLEQLEADLRAEADRLTGNLTKAFEQYIERAVDAGGGYSQAVAMDLFKKAGVSTTGLRSMFATVNRQAVEACWARTKKGLFLSDRIWKQGERYRNTMRDLIQESVATGQDAVKTARMLQQYARQGKSTLAANYPNMMKRMKGRIPGDISYEALRLARTEMTAAFGEGTIAAARVSPSYQGMKWILSSSHPLADICDNLAKHDEGLGEGVYAPDNEPPYPAHPNCLCVLIPVHEQPEEFVERLKKWRDNPESDPGLEKWYNDIYRKTSSQGLDALNKIAKKVEQLEKGITIKPDEDYVDLSELKYGDKIKDYMDGLYKDDYQKIITDDYEKAVRRYSGSGNYIYNAYLRGEDKELYSPDYYKKPFEDLLELLNKTELKENMKVYRGASTNWLGDMKWDDLEKGSVIVDKGFLSTSLNKEISEEFARGVKKGEPLIAELKVNKGTNGVFIDTFEQRVIFEGTVSESEIILKPGSNVFVEEKWIDENGIKRIKGTVFYD